MITSGRYCELLKRVGLICLTLFCTLHLQEVSAQTDSLRAMTAPRINADTVNVETVKEHSPTKALLLSAVLPGAGQVYNRQAWKVPIIYAAIGGVAYFTYTNYKQMKLHKDEYLYRVSHDDTPLNPELADRPTSNIYNLYEAYDKTFQLSVIISVAVYSINILDAYVFGHLFDFQISDDLTMNLSPVMMGSMNAYGFGVTPGAALSLKF